MKFIEDKLESLDDYFATKKKNERQLIIAGVFVFIAFMAYYFVLPYTEEMYKKSETRKKSIQKSIADNKQYLNSITVNGDREFKIKQYDKDIASRKRNIISFNEKINYINASLKKLSDMLFDQKSWSIFLDSITDKAEIHNVDIQYITNKYVDSNGSFGYVLETGIGCRGEYKGIVKFMNELEQNTLVTDIYSTKFTVDNNSSKIIADINVSVWGVNH